MTTTALTTSDNSLLADVLRTHAGLLATFPGDHDQGDLTGHGVEWRTSLLLASEVCPDDPSMSNDYVLTFALIEQGDRVLASLDLEYHVAEVGMSDKHSFQLDGGYHPRRRPVALQVLATQCHDWKVPEYQHAARRGSELIERVFDLMESVSYRSSPIVWGGA
jgi:hypothetical protein